MKRISFLLLCISATLVAGKNKTKVSKLNPNERAHQKASVSSEISECSSQNVTSMPFVYPSEEEKKCARAVARLLQKKYGGYKTTYSIQLVAMFQRILVLKSSMDWKDLEKNMCDFIETNFVQPDETYSKECYDHLNKLSDDCLNAEYTRHKRVNELWKSENLGQGELTKEDQEKIWTQMRVVIQAFLLQPQEKITEIVVNQLPSIVYKIRQERIAQKVNAEAVKTVPLEDEKECKREIITLLQEKHQNNHEAFREELQKTMNEIAVLHETMDWKAIQDHVCQFLQKDINNQKDINKKKAFAKLEATIRVGEDLSTMIEKKYPGPSNSSLRSILFKKLQVKSHEMQDTSLDRIKEILVEYINNAAVEIKRLSINDRVRTLLMQDGAIAHVLPIYISKIKEKSTYVEGSDDQKTELEEQALEKLENALSTINAGKKISDKTIRELVNNYRPDASRMTDEQCKKLLVIDTRTAYQDFVILTLNKERRAKVSDYVARLYPQYGENRDIADKINDVIRLLDEKYALLGESSVLKKERDQEEIDIENQLPQLETHSLATYQSLGKFLDDKSNDILHVLRKIEKEQAQVRSQEVIQKKQTDIEMPDLGVTFSSQADLRAFQDELRELQEKDNQTGENDEEQGMLQEPGICKKTCKKDKKLSQRIRDLYNVSVEENDETEKELYETFNINIEERLNSENHALAQDEYKNNPQLKTSELRKQYLSTQKQKHIQDFNAWQQEQYNEAVVALKGKFKFTF